MRDATLIISGPNFNVQQILRDVLRDDNHVSNMNLIEEAENKTKLTVEMKANEAFINEVRGNMFYPLGRLSNEGVEGYLIVAMPDGFPIDEEIRITA